jgi:hypothetical protein
MKYLRISNNGVLDKNFITLLGASSKSEDPSKIGQFGTGLKYAISYLLRSNTRFRIFVGETEVVVSTRTKGVGSQEFQEILVDGESINVTTLYGYQWQTWEALREIWCNALDEKNPKHKVIDGRSKIEGKKNTTTFFIEMKPEISAVVDDWGSYFKETGTKSVLYEDERVTIFYKEKPSSIRLYKQGILIHTSEFIQSIFDYDFKDTQLNELRQYRGSVEWDVITAILNSNSATINVLLQAFKVDKERTPLEVKSTYYDSVNCKTEKVKEIFSGYVFYHPKTSDIPNTKKAVKVNEGLFDRLSSCGLPCEDIKATGRYSGGGYYGASGYSSLDHKQVQYRIVQNPLLEARISKLLSKYKREEAEIVIAVPFGEDFEVLIQKDVFVLNSNVDIKNDKDLEILVLLYILHKKASNIYEAFKKVLKFLVNVKMVKKVLDV